MTVVLGEEKLKFIYNNNNRATIKISLREKKNNYNILNNNSNNNTMPVKSL